MKTSLRDKEQHHRKPLCTAALSSLPLGQISFMVSHAANDENWGLRGWERGYTPALHSYQIEVIGMGQQLDVRTTTCQSALKVHFISTQK